VFLQNLLGSLLKILYALLLIFYKFTQFLYTFLHALAYLFNRLFLTIDDGKREFEDFGKIGSEILSKPLLEAADSIIGEDVFLYDLAFLLEVLIIW
jgi:hypothetical protein